MEWEVENEINKLKERLHALENPQAKNEDLPKVSSTAPMTVVPKPLLEKKPDGN